MTDDEITAELKKIEEEFHVNSNSPGTWQRITNIETTIARLLTLLQKGIDE